MDEEFFQWLIVVFVDMLVRVITDGRHKIKERMTYINSDSGNTFIIVRQPRNPVIKGIVTILLSDEVMALLRMFLLYHINRKLDDMWQAWSAAAAIQARAPRARRASRRHRRRRVRRAPRTPSPPTTAHPLPPPPPPPRAQVMPVVPSIRITQGIAISPDTEKTADATRAQEPQDKQMGSNGDNSTGKEEGLH